MLQGPRRILVIAVSLIVIPVMIPIATTSASSAVLGLPSVDQPPLAKRGDRTPTVKKMQQQLVKAGITVAGRVDGIFGPRTEAALIQYQTQKGLPATGVLDVATATLLGVVQTTPLLSYGSRGETVRVVQQQLMTVGITLFGGADGVYGSATRAAVRQFQQSKGLAVTGAVDAGTAETLARAAAELTPVTTTPTTAPPATPPTTAPPTTPPTTTTTTPNVVLLSQGSRGEAVKAMQSKLIATGISVFGGADGVFGSATKSSLKQFQTRVGLLANGVYDTVTKAALDGATTPPTTVPPTTVPPTTTPPTTAPPTSTPNVVLLSVGSRGDAVKAMQSKLIATGISVMGGADGVFGPATQSSLKQFQTRAGLPSNGVFDTVTKAALDAAQPAPPLPPPGTIVLASFPVAPSCAFASTFGAPRSGGRKHEGVDIIVKSGTPIYAVVDGTITKKQNDYVGSLGGNALWLSAADGTYFFYAHQSAFADGIEVGSVVTAGTVIGYVGMTGNASVPHLHFEVHPRGGSAVDPYPIVKAATSCK